MKAIILIIWLNTPSGAQLVMEDYKNMTECEAGKKTAVQAVDRTRTQGFSIRSMECVPRFANN